MYYIESHAELAILLYKQLIEIDTTFSVSVEVVIEYIVMFIKYMSNLYVMDVKDILNL